MGNDPDRVLNARKNVKNGDFFFKPFRLFWQMVYHPPSFFNSWVSILFQKKLLRPLYLWGIIGVFSMLDEAVKIGKTKQEQKKYLHYLGLTQDFSSVP